MLARNAAVLALLAAAAAAQNLVPNPSFETYTSCPNNFAQVVKATPWTVPTLGSPDYFNACASASFLKVPGNAWGSQAAHSGQAYVAGICYKVGTGEFREYVEVQLTQPLQAGVQYDVEFWVSLADNSTRMIADIGAYLSIGPVGPVAIGGALPLTPQIANPSTVILSDATGWTKIGGIYTAAGGEDHIVLGNFKDKASTNVQSRTGSNIYAIYYFDDVRVEKRPGSGPSSRLIGWADLLSSSQGFIDVQDVPACTPAKTACQTTPPVQAAVSYAGGTAYDPRYRTVWVSDGNVMAEYFVAGASACKQRCAPFKATRLNPQALVSGLACADRRPRLFQLATLPGYMEITTYDTSGRCPGKNVTCSRSLPSEAVAAGLAYDESRDVLLISVSVPQAAGGWSTLLWTSAASGPCKILCEKPLYTCSKRPVLGLAHEVCKSARTLYATDGQLTQTFDVLDPATCDFKVGKCCPKQSTPIWRGLAVIPYAKIDRVGKSCTAQPCPSCPQMALDAIGGEPVLGNSAFGLQVTGAPTGALAVTTLKGGPCGAGLPLPPPFCGRLYTLPIGFAFPPLTLTGSGTCGGTGTTPLPLPNLPSLCGAVLCVQSFVVCRQNNQFGYGLTQALELTIGGS